MTAQDFRILMSAERKTEKGIPLTSEEEEVVHTHGLFPKRPQEVVVDDTTDVDAYHNPFKVL